MARVAPFPLIRAVLEGSQAGTVSAADGPAEAAFVLTRFGFAQWVGDDDATTLDGTVGRLLAARPPDVPGYWLWYAPPARWAARLDEQGPGSVRRRERCRWVWRAPPPSVAKAAGRGDAELRPLDAALLPQAAPLGLQLGGRFWSSAEDVVRKGFGVCAVQGDRVVSLCYAACVAGGMAEVDVATLPEFRGRGLARAVASRFVHDALARGVQPTWDCFTENAASMQLAQALGFSPERRYPLYSFNVPLSLGASAEAGPNGGDR